MIHPVGFLLFLVLLSVFPDITSQTHLFMPGVFTYTSASGGTPIKTAPEEKKDITFCFEVTSYLFK
jgi:hypothetical protein